MTEQRLRDLMEESTAEVHAPSGLAERAWRSGHPHRRRRALVVAGASILTAAVIAVVYVALRPTNPDPDAVKPSSPVTASASSSCVSDAPKAVLPVWARAGFKPPTSPVRYLTGVNGNIVAIFFADRLTSPPRTNVNNKILWVSRSEGNGDPFLKIDARLAGTKVRTSRTVHGGPGPSTIDLPAPGCWILNLSWSGHHDTVSIRYVAR